MTPEGLQSLGFEKLTLNSRPSTLHSIVSFERLLDDLIRDTVRVSLPAFAAELVVCVTIVLLLLGRLFGTDRVVTPKWVALVGAVAAFVAAAAQFGETFSSGRTPLEQTSLFTGLLVNDPLSVYMRILLCGVLVLTTWLSAVSGLPDREDGPDFHTLLFGSTLGALLMAESNNLLMLFLSVEMTSVPAYALVGFQKGRRQSGEAALKYLVYGAGAAGVLLYGTSLVGGALGSASLETIAERMPSVVGVTATPLASAPERTVVLGALFIFAGLAFKLALVPFHFWCPDAFEGASAEVAGFLSVAPKAAAFALLVRVVDALFGSPSAEEIRYAFGIGLAVVSALTMTLGNLAAFGQQNVKRLFAYSTIAHAGYLLMGVAAWMVAGGEAGQRGLEGLFYYLAVYVFMNLGAFAVVAIVRNATYSEELDDYGGLWARLPIACGGMAVCCLSLIGIWPAGGFIGKFMMFAASISAGWVSGVMWALVAVAALNTVWSLFYYARVLKAMYLDAPADPDRLAAIKASPMADALVLAFVVPVLLLGVFVEPVSRVTAFVARAFAG